jgi:hypothetical protein
VNTTNQICPVLHAIKTYTIADPQCFWTMVQAVGIVITLLLIWKQMRIQSAANMLRALSDFSKEWWSTELIDARKEVCRSYRDKKSPGDLSAERISGFFETLGLYYKRNMVDSHLAWGLYSYYVEHYWPILQPAIKEMRKTDNTIFTDFEQFHNEMKAVSKRKNAPSDVKPEVSWFSVNWKNGMDELSNQSHLFFSF